MYETVQQSASIHYTELARTNNMLGENTDKVRIIQITVWNVSW